MNQQNIMQILEIAPPYFPITPRLKYGGIERNILYLLEQFSRLEHKPILMAPGDSSVQCKHIPTIKESIWINGVTISGENTDKQVEAHYARIVDYILSNPDIDIIHDHPGTGLIDSAAYKKYETVIKKPIVITLHGSARPEKIRKIKQSIAKSKNKVYVNGISFSQRKLFSELGDFPVIYHGIPLSLFNLETEKQDYLLSLGRISFKKGQHTAIETAKKLGLRLILAGEVHDIDKKYYDTIIKPQIKGPQIEYVGPLTDIEKAAYFQKAQGFLMPIEWDEPFGLVMIEAMACGTPVVGYDRGSVREIIAHNKTGYVVPVNTPSSLERFIEATSKVTNIEPVDCRKHVETNFTIDKEAEQYISFFKKILNNN
jgi:glycosyltransferase involved in cell wall biosynthesis